MNYKVEKSDFKTPPEDSYFLDLVWIEPCEFTNGPAYKWHWKIADVPAQKEWAGIGVSSLTSRTPTLRNRFGQFLKVLNNGLEEGKEGSTEDICMAAYRVKGFVEHNKRTVEGEDQIFCNVDKLIEGSAKAGEGIGIKGASEKLKPAINEYLTKAGKPPLKLEEKESAEKASTGAAKETVTGPKKKDIPW